MKYTARVGIVSENPQVSVYTRFETSNSYMFAICEIGKAVCTGLDAISEYDTFKNAKIIARYHITLIYGITD